MAERFSREVMRASRVIADKLGTIGRTAVVLGSGLGNAIPSLVGEKFLEYKNIPGFFSSSVKGHSGRMITGEFFGRKVIILKGRPHYYEGHSMPEVTFPVRVLKNLGVRNIILTAAAGQVSEKFMPGELVLVRDHINFMGVNPLRADKNYMSDEMFPDMSQLYSPALAAGAREAFRTVRVKFKEGVYAALSGPSYETPAEIRALSKLGADIVGMSMAPEAMAAHQMGMNVLGIAFVSNGASQKISHEDVLKEGKKVLPNFAKALKEIIKQI